MNSQREKNDGVKERGNDFRGLSLNWERRWDPHGQLMCGRTRKEGEALESEAGAGGNMVEGSADSSS